MLEYHCSRSVSTMIKHSVEGRPKLHLETRNIAVRIINDWVKLYCFILHALTSQRFFIP